jgi:Na+/H+-translocating membrane pyrophosphatase
MGSDLFGSLSEATCAALVIGTTSNELLMTSDAIYFPLMLTAIGIIVSFITTFFATNFTKVRMDNVESTIKWQLIISTVLMTAAIFPAVSYLPEKFSFDADTVMMKTYTTRMQAYYCVLSGLWSGFFIGWVTEVYTSNAYSPV